MREPSLHGLRVCQDIVRSYDDEMSLACLATAAAVGILSDSSSLASSQDLATMAQVQIQCRVGVWLTGGEGNKPLGRIPIISYVH